MAIWLNGHELAYDEEDAFGIVVRVAAGRSSLTEITEWLASRIERPK